MIIVNGLQPLTIITKSFTLDVAAVLDPPLINAAVVSYLNESKYLISKYAGF